ncbi:hypothetical protein Q4R49_07670 [Morganella morganii subsp. sibonii]
MKKTVISHTAGNTAGADNGENHALSSSTAQASTGPPHRPMVKRDERLSGAFSARSDRPLSVRRQAANPARKCSALSHGAAPAS